LINVTDGSGSYHATPGAIEGGEPYPGTDIPPIADEPAEGLPF
jgi:hypothetical protein